MALMSFVSSAALIVLVPVLLVAIRPSTADPIATVLRAIAEVVRAFRGGHR